MKKKTLFDHIKQITSTSDTKYYDNLSEEDKKTFNVYMINRFLSMNSNWIEMVNEIQKYSQYLKQRGTLKVYNEIIPKRYIFLKYVKPKKQKDYNQQVINILKKYYELGDFQIKEYYDILRKSPNELLNIVKLYGGSESEFRNIEEDLIT